MFMQKYIDVLSPRERSRLTRHAGHINRAEMRRYRAGADPGGAGSANAKLAQAMAQNQMARSLIIDRAIEMTQVINTQTFAGGAVGQVVGTVINVPVRNVGFIKRFIVEVTGTVNIGAAENQTLTKWGIANLLSQIVFTDLSNQTRVNTQGWHLHALATARRQNAFGAAFLNDSPVSIGSNFKVISAAANVSAATGALTFRMFYEVPVCYGDYDFRGGIYANVVNGTMNLQMVINPQFFIAAGSDATLSAYQSSTAQLGILSAVTVTTYQQYLDQIPPGPNGAILPQMDISTAYLINNTQVAALSVNLDNPIPYANFRNFMSTFAIYDNGGLNAGSDVTSWALQSANYTNIWKLDPFIASLFTRQAIGDDFPAGTYYFNHRAKPISTIQYGNMQLVLTPSNVAGATSQVLVGYEALAAINQIVAAGSLYGT